MLVDPRPGVRRVPQKGGDGDNDNDGGDGKDKMWSEGGLTSWRIPILSVAAVGGADAVENDPGSASEL